MEFKEFLEEISNLGWGLIAANTYYQHGKEHIFIMIGEKGNSGIFEKREFELLYMNNILNEWVESLVS